MNACGLRSWHLFAIVYSVLLVTLGFVTSATGQDNSPAPKLFIAGGAMPEAMYSEFLKLTGPDARLVVVPTATSRKVDAASIKKRWKTRGFEDVQVLHTRDSKVASSVGFADPIKTATAVWFSGGSQQRIADAYLGTDVERELYKLLRRGGVIGGSSAGAAIQSKVMIGGGRGDEPRISTGFDLLPGSIIDQHFLKRNRISRLTAAVRANPGLTGYGIDEATAIVVRDNKYVVVGESYVLRIRLVGGVVRTDAFENGEEIPTSDK